jgi:hypothetical protein
LELLELYVDFRSSDKGMIFEIVVKTSVNICTSFSSYALFWLPVCRPPISVKHFSVTFLNSGISKNRVRRVSMMGVSKIYPSGIQLKKRSSVSSVALIKLAWVALFKTSLQSWKMDENSAHITVFRFFVLAEVIWSAEKSKTSSDSSLKMDMLFSQMDRLVWQEEMISLMNVGQL